MAHNCFPFTPIIMKLHTQTPHEARMCPIDFEVKRSKVKVTMHKLLNNCPRGGGGGISPVRTDPELVLIGHDGPTDVICIGWCSC